MYGKERKRMVKPFRGLTILKLPPSICGRVVIEKGLKTLEKHEYGGIYENRKRARK